MKRVWFIAWLALVVAGPGWGVPIISITGGTGAGVDPLTVGFRFSVEAPMIATHLGMYDWGSNGAGADEPRPMGLWNAAGALLGTKTLPAGTTAGNGQFVYIALDSRIPLVVGETYTVGVHYGTNSSPGVVINATGFQTAPGINYLGSVMNGGGFSKPTGLVPIYDPGLFGPNVLAIPEASTYALFGLGALGLMVWRKRRSR